MHQFFMLTMLTNSLIFTQMNHPLSMGIILFIQTILISIFTGLISKSFWFSYILFLIFIGGMLILFIYMASIASNEQMNFSYLNFLFFSFLIFMFFISIFNDTLLNFFNFNKNLILDKNSLLIDNILPLSNIFNYSNNLIIIMLILYLLLTLIAVVKITDLFMGPLRPKNFYE